FLPAQRGPGISRTNSPAIGGGTNGRLSEDEGVDMKEVDGLLNETAMMLGRWSLYSRFLASKCRDPETDPDEPLVMPELLIKSALSRKISARLTTPFNIMTTFFFRRSVEKAFQLDESPAGLSLNLSKPIDGNPPFIISPVDDVMYIVNTVLQRSLSTSQRDVIASVIPTIGRVLGSDFVGMIQRKMRDESYPKPVIQGGFPPEDKILSFIILINSLDIANDYIARIVTSRISPTDSSAASLADLYPFAHDATFVRNSLESLNATFSSKTGELITDGLTVLFERVVKLRLRPVVRDVFRDVDYTLTEEELDDQARQNDEDEDADVQHDLVARRFEHAWDSIMKPIQRIMTPKCFTLLLDSTAKDLAKVLDKRVWGYAGKMSAHGASRMERDFSGIIGVVARGGRYGVRDLFARVSQVCMLVNMEEEEWEAINEVEEEGEEEMAWVLTEDERKRARALVR
ncbi:Conserved oligomeric Golgi complex subunit, partial [Lachnellula willkommii]